MSDTLGTAALIIEACIATVIVYGLMWFFSPMIIGFESITPDASIDTGSPEYVNIGEYTKYLVLAPAFLLFLVVLGGIIYIKTHIGSDDNVY